MSRENIAIQYVESNPTEEKLRAEAIAEQAIGYIEENPRSIGEGAVAEVITFQSRSVAVCLKKIKKYLALADRPYNTISGEMRQMERARLAGIRTPRPYFSIEIDNPAAQDDPEEPLVLEYLAMEKIEGHSLNDIFTRAKLKFPENFNLDLFMDRLTDYVRRAHDNGLYHRDLHDANVMVDQDTGEPVIIDWGQAKVCLTPEDAYEEESVVPSGRIYLDDDKQLLVIRRLIENYFAAKQI